MFMIRRFPIKTLNLIGITNPFSNCIFALIILKFSNILLKLKTLHDRTYFLKINS